MLLLADFSNNNPEPINFPLLQRGGLWGCWHKVSEGTTYTDPYWLGRSRRARRARLHVGGYHFARPRRGDAHAQAAHFAAALGPVERRDLHPFLDLEVNDDGLSADELWRWAHEFGLHVHALRGVHVQWYTSPAFLAGLRWTRPLGSGAGLLIAAYGPDDGRDHGMDYSIAPWRSYVAHQFTSRGWRHGAPGRVDLWHGRSRRALLAHGLRGLA